MKKQAWGQLTILDLPNCEHDILTDKLRIREFCSGLCSKIGMRPYGPPVIERFGEGNLRGISATQLIETSSITVHCDEIDNRVFVDIFSCKEFNDVDAWKYCEEYFGSGQPVVRTFYRG